MNQVLQYLLSLMVVLVLSLFTRFISIIGYQQTIPFYIFAILNIISVLNLIVEIITFTFCIRPAESKPITEMRNSSIFRAMRERRSCRSFQTQKLSQSDFNDLMQYVKAQALSSSSSHVGDTAIRFEYVNAPLTYNAVEFLVVIVPAQYNRHVVIDCGRCLQKIMVYATTLDIATCCIGTGPTHDSIVQQLGASRFNEDKDHIICACAIGYKSTYEPLMMRFVRWFQSNNRFGRLPLTQLIYHNDINSNAIEPFAEEMFCMDPLERFASCFEGCRWSPSSFNAQTTRCVVVTEENHINRLDFYASTSSRYYAAVAVGMWLANLEMGCEEVGIRGCFKKLEVEEMKYQISTEKNENNAMDDAPSVLRKYDISWIVLE